MVNYHFKITLPHHLQYATRQNCKSCRPRFCKFNCLCEPFKARETYKSTIGALIPLLVTSIASAIQVAGALGRFYRDIVLLIPWLGGAEAVTSRRWSFSPVGDTDCNVMQLGKCPKGMMKDVRRFPFLDTKEEEKIHTLQQEATEWILL